MNTHLFGGFEDEPQIDLTPLIDCLFMLIIFFVLTTSFSRPVLEVVLPQAEHAETPQDRNQLIVSVKSDGSLHLNGEAATLQTLSRALDAKPDHLLNIHMDENAPFSVFVSVMDLAKVKRAGRFVISTREKEQGAAPQSP